MKLFLGLVGTLLLPLTIRAQNNTGLQVKTEKNCQDCTNSKSQETWIEEFNRGTKPDLPKIAGIWSGELRPTNKDGERIKIFIDPKTQKIGGVSASWDYCVGKGNCDANAYLQFPGSPFKADLLDSGSALFFKSYFRPDWNSAYSYTYTIAQVDDKLIIKIEECYKYTDEPIKNFGIIRFGILSKEGNASKAELKNHQLPGFSAQQISWNGL